MEKCNHILLSQAASKCQASSEPPTIMNYDKYKHAMLLNYVIYFRCLSCEHAWCIFQQTLAFNTIFFPQPKADAACLS